MVNHKSLKKGNFWAPPGGGIDFGQRAQDTLIKEFNEETGLTVKQGAFLFACEFIQKPLHAVELFFEVFYESGQLKKGIDPEMSPENQIITEVKFLNPEEINHLKPDLHGIFRFCEKPEEVNSLRGYFAL